MDAVEPGATGSEPRTEDLGYRLDALLDELVAAGWSGEFDARERAALNRLGWVRAEAARTADDRLREALEQDARVVHLMLVQDLVDGKDHRQPFDVCPNVRCASRRALLALPLPDRPVEPVGLTTPSLDLLTDLQRFVGYGGNPDVLGRVADALPLIESAARREGWDAALAAVQEGFDRDFPEDGVAEVLARLAAEGPQP